MAKFNVTGEEVLRQNYGLQQKFNEFFRQINQNNGYPFNFDELMSYLQNGTEGRFHGENAILRLLSRDENITISACSGKKTLSQAGEVFKSYVDPDLKNWGLDKNGKTTGSIPVQVYEMIKDSTFSQIFGSFGIDLDKLCLAQNQIKIFCKDNTNWLRTDGYPTFFLFKKDENEPAVIGNLFVAYVVVYSDGLRVIVRRFEYGFVWLAEFLHRVVVPQQTI